MWADSMLIASINSSIALAVDEDQGLAVALFHVMYAHTLIRGALGLPFVFFLVIVVVILGQGGQAHLFPLFAVQLRLDIVVIVIVIIIPALLAGLDGLCGLLGLLFLLGGLFDSLHGEVDLGILADILGIDKLLYLKHYAHVYILLSPQNSIEAVLS